MSKIITIDGDAFSDRFGFDLEIKRKFTKDLSWVNYTVSQRLNLDSTNDFLRGGFGVMDYEEPIIVQWRDSEKSRHDLGKEETVCYLEDILKTCHPSARRSLLEKIESVKKGSGQSLFDMIVELMKGHKNIDLILV